jgi:phenylpropionate dioxygenase-like ring-hydroxylating dioxygenase large terminal subunit
VARGLEPRHYVDAGVFALERERVFGGSWVPVCREEDVASPGDYVTYRLAGDPIVVTRTRDGALAALANVCRHRNMVIVDGAGSAKALQCPYHLWTYSLDGRLTGAPGMAEVSGFDGEALCLPRLAVDTWHGFVVVNTDVDAPPLGPQLSGLEPLLAGTRIDEMVRVGSIEWDQPWNWKLTFENYAESYHHRAIHPETLQPLFPGERSRPRPGGGEPWMALEHEVAAEGIDPLLVVGVYPLLWPSLVGAESMAWLKIEVLGPSRSRLWTEVFLPPEHASDPDAVAFHVEAVRAVNAQDEVPNRGVFAGVGSRYAVPSTLHPLEASVAHFTEWYRARMGEP